MAQLSLSGLSFGQETPLATPLTAHDTDNTSDDSNPIPSIYRCRAPIASLDCMDEFSTNSQLVTAEPANMMTSFSYVFNHNTIPISKPPTLRYKNLGKSGLRVSNLSLALWCPLAEVSEDIIQQMVSVALESGINTFDLSEAHTGAEMEEAFGRILKKINIKRCGINIMTKIYWSTKCDEHGISRKHIVDSVNESLKRLQVDYIDVVNLHKFDELCPMEELVRTMTYLIEQGKILYWGTSRWSPHEIMDAFTHCRQFNCTTPIVDQSEYHMFLREKIELYLPEIYYRIGVGAYVIGTMAWSAATLGKGMTGTDVTTLFAKSKFNKKFCSFSFEEEDITSCENKEELEKKNEGETVKLRTFGDKLLDLLGLSVSLHCSLTQLSIAWCLKNEDVNSVLIGATTVNNLREQIFALTVIPLLTEEVINKIENIVSNKPIRPPMVSTLVMRNLQSLQINDGSTTRLDLEGSEVQKEEEPTEGATAAGEEASSSSISRAFCRIQ